MSTEYHAHIMVGVPYKRLVEAIGGDLVESYLEDELDCCNGGSSDPDDWFVGAKLEGCFRSPEALSSAASRAIDNMEHRLNLGVARSEFQIFAVMDSI